MKKTHKRKPRYMWCKATISKRAYDLVKQVGRDYKISPEMVLGILITTKIRALYTKAH